MKIDKSDKTDLADYEINPACAVNGTIYYKRYSGKIIIFMR